MSVCITAPPCTEFDPPLRTIELRAAPSFLAAALPTADATLLMMSRPSNRQR